MEPSEATKLLERVLSGKTPLAQVVGVSPGLTRELRRSGRRLLLEGRLDEASEVFELLVLLEPHPQALEQGRELRLLRSRIQEDWACTPQAMNAVLERYAALLRDVAAQEVRR